MALTFSILNPKPSRTNFKQTSDNPSIQVGCRGLPKPSPHPHPAFASLFVSAGGRVPSRCGRAWWGRRPISIWPQPWACASMAWFHDMVTRVPAWRLEVPARSQLWWAKWTLETLVFTPIKQWKIFGLALKPILVGLKGGDVACLRVTRHFKSKMHGVMWATEPKSRLRPHQMSNRGAKGPKGCTPSLNLNLVCCAPKGMKPPFSTMAGKDRSCLFDSYLRLSRMNLPHA